MSVGEVAPSLVELALERLTAERASNYEESTHRMRFPRQLGFTGAEEVQRGDVFARAVMADALCDARDAGVTQATEWLSQECEHLLAKRCRSASGGWSYFPGLPELPSDADTLAQVAQVLVRCGRAAELQRHVEVPLCALLDSDHEGDGGIGTWVLPSRPRSCVESRQIAFVRNAWGDTRDSEVIANLLYALALYDSRRFGETIANGVRYLCARQGHDGAWASTWYAGPYYGTYVCARLLAQIGGSELVGDLDRAPGVSVDLKGGLDRAPTVAVDLTGSLDRARGFLEDSARTGRWYAGGWNQLAVALALCARAAIEESLCVRHCELPWVLGALEELLSDVRSRGFVAEPFIVMNLGRAQGRSGPLVRYASSAITAAYVLKAAVAWHQVGHA